MKVGDKVQGKGSFSIEEYFPEERVLEIKFFSTGMKEFIPAVIHYVGIRFRENSFHIPGDYNPSTSPEYYKRISLTRNGAIYLHEGKKYTITLADDFLYTGEYFLEPVEAGITLRKYAHVMTAGEHTERIEEYKGNLMDESMLSGVVDRIFVHSPKDDITYFEDTELALESFVDTEIFVVFHDAVVHIDYCLTLKNIIKC